MRLKTLGGLYLEDSGFTRPTLLVMLSYLILEGKQSRRHLAELFWQGNKALRSLTTALILIRKGAGNVIETDPTHVWTSLESDVKDLLTSLEQGDWQAASERYSGAFLEGIVLAQWGNELEEWVYATREYLAERVQFALLNLAEEAARSQNFKRAVALAEQAYKLPGLTVNNVNSLKRLYPLLCAGNSLIAPLVRKEAETYDLRLDFSSAEARSKYPPQTTRLAITLPLRNTSFVGRTKELAELKTLVQKPGKLLLSLVGTGGIGKTRLALQLAHEQQQAGAFKHGIYFISLETLETASLLASSLITGLGLNATNAQDPFEQLASFLAEQDCLLILDNFEHLTEAAVLLSELLARTFQLKLVITTREVLRLEEEHVFKVEGLGFANQASEKPLHGDAAQLFKERAQQLNHPFSLIDNLADVIHICQLVDGMPLAIELAASWIRLMSCKEIAAEIEHSLEFLTSFNKNIPDRHRSLRAILDASWQLLRPNEQDVLCKMTIFRAGFSREAAAHVAGATISILASLVNKSLLKVTPNGRYELHPLIHHFSHKKLAESVVEKDLGTSHHANFYASLLKEMSQLFKGPKEKIALDSLKPEIQNISQTWNYLISRQQVQELQLLIQPLSQLFINLGMYQQGLVLLDTAILALDNTDQSHFYTRGELCISKARFLCFLASFSEAITEGEKGLQLIEASKPQDSLLMARGHNEIARSHLSLGNLGQAIIYFEKAHSLLKVINELHRAADMLGNLAICFMQLSDYDKAEQNLQEASVIFEKVQDWEGFIWALNLFQTIRHYRQAYNESLLISEQALELYRQKHLSSPWVLCEIYTNQGISYRFLEQFGLAFQAYEKALELAEETDFFFKLPSILSGLGYCSSGIGQYIEARAYFKRSLELLRSSGERVTLFNTLIGWSKNELSLGNYKDASLVLGFVQTEPKLDDIDNLEAMSALTLLRTKLDQNLLDTNLTCGKTMSLSQVFDIIDLGFLASN